MFDFLVPFFVLSTSLHITLCNTSPPLPSPPPLPSATQSPSSSFLMEGGFLYQRRRRTSVENPYKYFIYKNVCSDSRYHADETDGKQWRPDNNNNYSLQEGKGGHDTRQTSPPPPPSPPKKHTTTTINPKAHIETHVQFSTIAVSPQSSLKPLSGSARGRPFPPPSPSPGTPGPVTDP